MLAPGVAVSGKLYGHMAGWEVETMHQKDAVTSIIDSRATRTGPNGRFTIIADRSKHWALEITFFKGLREGQVYRVRTQVSYMGNMLDKDYSFDMTAQKDGSLYGRLPSGWIKDNVDDVNRLHTLIFWLGNKKVKFEPIGTVLSTGDLFSNLVIKAIDNAIIEEKKSVLRNQRLANEEARAKRLGIRVDMSRVDILDAEQAAKEPDLHFKRNVGSWVVATNLTPSKAFLNCKATLKGSGGSLMVSMGRSSDVLSLRVIPDWTVIDKHQYQSRLKFNDHEKVWEMRGLHYAYGNRRVNDLVVGPDGWSDMFKSSKSNANLNLWVENKKMVWRLTDTDSVIRALNVCVHPNIKQKISSDQANKKVPMKMASPIPVQIPVQSPAPRPVSQMPVHPSPIKAVQHRQIQPAAPQAPAPQVSRQTPPPSKGFEIRKIKDVGSWDIGAMYQDGAFVGCFTEISSEDFGSVAVLGSSDQRSWQLRFTGVIGFQNGERVDMSDQVNGGYSSQHVMYFDQVNESLAVEVSDEWLNAFFGTLEASGSNRKYEALVNNSHASWNISGADAAFKGLLQCIDQSNTTAQASTRHAPKPVATRAPPRQARVASPQGNQFGAYAAIYMDRNVVKDVIVQGKDIYVKIASIGNITVKKSNAFKAAYSKWYQSGFVKEVGISNATRRNNKKGYTWRINTSAKFIEYYVNGRMVLHLKRG